MPGVADLCLYQVRVVSGLLDRYCNQLSLLLLLVFVRKFILSGW